MRTFKKFKDNLYGVLQFREKITVDYTVTVFAYSLLIIVSLTAIHQIAKNGHE
jgi:hypothetical protein